MSVRPNVTLTKQLCISPRESDIAGRVARWINTNYPEPDDEMFQLLVDAARDFAGEDAARKKFMSFASVGIVYVDFPRAAELLASNLQQHHGLVCTFITGDMEDEAKMKRLDAIFDEDKWGFKVDARTCYFG